MSRRRLLKLLPPLLLTKQFQLAQAVQSDWAGLTDGRIVDSAAPLSERELLENLNHRFARGERKLIVSRNVRITESIIIPSGVTLIFNGTIFNMSRDQALLMKNSQSSIVRFRSILGTGTDEKQSALTIVDSCDCIVLGEVISGNLNKGIDLLSTENGVSEGNQISVRRISGSSGKSGAGISIYGRGSRRNTIFEGLYSENRIGITINGASYNKIFRSECNENHAAGVMIDGMVSGSGDGASFNILRGITCDRNGLLDGGYGGIYLGNGASNNLFECASANGNFGAGCRLSGRDEFELNRNVFDGLVIRKNSRGGFISSWSPETEIKNLISISNGGHGIHLFNCDGSVVSGNLVSNKGDGLRVQSRNIVAQNLRASLNDEYGIHLAFGGRNKPSIQLRNVESDGNARMDYSAPAGSIEYD